MRLIDSGVIDRGGVHGLAARLHVSERHLHRQLTAEVGAAPLALARARRARTARVLIEGSELSFSEVSHAAGFGSLRQFNETIQSVFHRTPTQLRAGAGAVASAGTVAGTGATTAAPILLELKLPFRPPLDFDRLLHHLKDRSVDGVEEVIDARYRRTLALEHGHSIIELELDGDRVACRLQLTDLRDVTSAVARCRRLLDLDADPADANDFLAQDPALRASIDRAPGLRAPGSVDAHETAIRAVLGQQVTVAAARTLLSRLVARCESRCLVPDPTLTHVMPTCLDLAERDLDWLPMPASRISALRVVARALAEGSVVLDEGVDRAEAELALRALPGIGPWTAGYIRMRGLSDPDCFLPTDAAVRSSFKQLGLESSEAGIRARSDAWRPWRSAALHHIWTSITHN